MYNPSPGWPDQEKRGWNCCRCGAPGCTPSQVLCSKCLAEAEKGLEAFHSGDELVKCPSCGKEELASWMKDEVCFDCRMQPEEAPAF